MPHRLTIVRPPDVGVALAQAVSRLSTVPLRIDRDSLPRASAHLACGDFESVRDLLRTAGADPALPLMLARYVRWTGDLQGAAAIWPLVLDALDDVLAPDADPALRQDTAALLQGTATDLGDAPLAARLHRYARDTAAAPAAKDGDPDVDVICDVAHELLGIEPDASRGRLRLRPRLGTRDVIEARHIRFADGSVALLAERDGSILLFRVEQVEGSIPITLLLEPFVDEPRNAEIDGRPAELLPQTVDGDTIVPVQLVLDDVRTLAVRTGAG